MSLFAWLRPAAPALDDALHQRLARLPKPAPLGVCSLRDQRWVVLDLETSGLNPNRDQVLSIGAVAIEDGAIDFSQQFERTLHRPAQKTNASVLIHGLGPSALAAGSDPAEALLELLEFIGDSPVLAFHAPFDQRMLARALKETLGHRLQLPFLDVAELAPMLNPDTVLREAGLDDWVARFGLQVDERHHASADAQVTAELALILFSQARRQQLDSPLQLEQRLRRWRRRNVQGHGL
ncbi:MULTISPECIES: 3'-5' exonuclease [Pseudomonas]|jgi:DNA polymerase-3 subunit epsilon|uniref:Exonuclease RNase T and DNA polymerase III n=1 Tax=Pseudomonas putida (strain W619) TaxID=390235 RepID=B1JE64_PSEPW|nr:MULTISPECIES: 3'-5' exonuclease [Pseudomonas]MDH1575942.1 3'-5' exonuclease [Pseudomonas sp. GD03746]QQE83764.1 3'-5' exonuclease [Pseudomonas putida]UTL80915.1 3'-5' exonuclease [Pseudomonas putida]HEN8711978.1 3'-5' exonuclease [Pseudomonas putida]HEN8717138.1 3'-5' exonuclease [Pseudomonas putida]